MDRDHQQELGELLERWFLAVENGEAVDARTFCGDHPELQADFLRLLNRAAAVDDCLAPPPMAQDATAMPDRLGDFEIVAALGSGGSGDVFLARQITLRRLVALKLLRTDDSPRSRLRLRREAEVAASLDHPGIVPIYAVGEDAGRSWIAMKWLTGPALDGLEKPLPPRRAAAIAAATARALHEAHTAGIIHRDIKPSNVVLDGDVPCLVDFGLARERETLTRTTVDGHVSGTLLYMSPEQLRSGGSSVTLDGRTDVYSLGATLFELLAGYSPFEGDHPGKVIHQILEQDPPVLAIDRDLETIVLRAMDKDRERRFPSALAMAEELERFLAGEPILSRRVGVTTRLWKLARRNRSASVMVAAALLIALLLGASLAWTVHQQSLAHAAAVVRVREEIVGNRLAMARRLLEPLQAANGEDASVRELHQSLEACEQLEELLDQVQGLPDDAHVEDLRAAVVALDMQLLPVHRRLELQVARPLALAICGDRKAAAALANELPEGRSRAAILAAITDRTEAWDLPAAATAADHLFCALALRLANRPLPERREEITKGRALAPTDWRLRLQHAIQLINEEQHATAYEVLDGLPRDGRYPRIVRRLFLHLTVLLGRDKAAAEHLARFAAEHALSTWTAADAATALDAHYWLEQSAAELLSWARGRWPTESKFMLLAARAKATEDAAAARALFAESVRLARSDRQRFVCEMARLDFEAAQVPAYWDPWYESLSVDQGDHLRELAQRAAVLRASVHDEPSVVASGLLQSRALLAVGDIAAALPVLAELGDSPLVELERAQLALSHSTLAGFVGIGEADEWQRGILQRVAVALGSNWQQHVASIRPRLQSALLRLAPRSHFHGRAALGMGWLLAARLAHAASDCDAALQAVSRARSLFPPDQNASAAALLDFIENACKR